MIQNAYHYCSTIVAISGSSTLNFDVFHHIYCLKSAWNSTQNIISAYCNECSWPALTEIFRKFRVTQVCLAFVPSKCYLCFHESSNKSNDMNYFSNGKVLPW